MLHALFFLLVLHGNYLAGYAAGDVTLYKFNCESRKSVKIDVIDCTSINTSQCSYFITHGWTENGFTNEIILLANSYCQMNKNVNIFLVDYAKRASEFYTNAPNIAKEVGDELATKLLEIKDKCNLELSKIDLIGFSLGGQVVGQAGFNIFKTTGIKIRRIVGLDPAGPLFIQDLTLYPLLGRRLTKDDANNVYVIHGSAIFGSDLPMGSVDMYYNKFAPTSSCPKMLIDNIKTNFRQILGALAEFLIDAVACNHYMALYYFNASINSCGIEMHKVQPCLISCAPVEKEIFGQHMKPDLSGIYEIDVEQLYYPYFIGEETYPNCYCDCNHET